MLLQPLLNLSASLRHCAAWVLCASLELELSGLRHMAAHSAAQVRRRTLLLRVCGGLPSNAFLADQPKGMLPPLRKLPAQLKRPSCMARHSQFLLVPLFSVVALCRVHAPRPGTGSASAVYVPPVSCCGHIALHDWASGSPCQARFWPRGCVHGLAGWLAGWRASGLFDLGAQPGDIAGAVFCAVTLAVLLAVRMTPHARGPTLLRFGCLTRSTGVGKPVCPLFCILMQLSLSCAHPASSRCCTTA